MEMANFKITYSISQKTFYVRELCLTVLTEEHLSDMFPLLESLELHFFLQVSGQHLTLSELDDMTELLQLA